MTDRLLIAAHGSRDDDGVAECRRFVDLVASRRPELPTGLGFIELAPPPIHDAVADLVQGGATTITVVPLVLLGAGHAKTDVPAAIERERHAHPQIDFRYGAPLGVHPDVLSVLEDRVSDTIGSDDPSVTAVLVVGRGSSDPDANSDLHKIARLLWEGRGYPIVETAFVGITHPRVEAGLERCRALGAARIVVAPYFLFTGVLVERIAEQASAWAARHPDVEVRTADHLGVDRRIADLVLSRHDEARHDLVRPNCDRCIYRTALPGFEDEVGKVQTMHHHPDDPHTHDRPGDPHTDDHHHHVRQGRTA